MFSSISPAVQALIITSLTGGAYLLAYRLNEYFDSWALFAQGITLIFLPAGIKHLSILLGGKWGALGCFLALFALAHEFWAGQPYDRLALYSLISTASTWGAIVFSLWVLGISASLKELRFYHLPMIDLITTAAHGFATNTYFIMSGMKSDHLIENALAMMFGDFAGSFILLTLLWIGLSIFKKNSRDISSN